LFVGFKDNVPKFAVSCTNILQLKALLFYPDSADFSDASAVVFFSSLSLLGRDGNCRRVKGLIIRNY